MRIDPELRVAAARPRLDRADPATARRLTAGPAPEAVAGVTVSEHEVPSTDGHAVRLRRYRPDDRTFAVTVYHVHGGGFVLGDLDSGHLRNAEIAREVGADVVAVEYRLAPEHPFPAPLEDVYAGLTWLGDGAVLHGLSAGGALAAGAALLARDRGGPTVRGQLLVSPVVDDRLRTASSRLMDTPALTRRDLELCWAAYLGPGEVSPYAAPARARLTGLPRTYVSVAEHDPLRDEGIDFARALLAAGVTVELHLFPGTFHGSLAVPDAAVSIRQRTEETTVLRTLLGDR